LNKSDQDGSQTEENENKYDQEISVDGGRKANGETINRIDPIVTAPNKV
jgi:hypothetical protein